MITTLVGAWFFRICCIVVVLLLTISDVQAGPASAFEKNILARAAAGRALTNAERVALERLWREADAKALAGIEREFARSLNTRQLTMAKGTPAAFMEKNDFDAYLASISPNLTAAQRAQYMGFYLDGRIYFNRAHTDHLPIVIAHERLHAISNPLFKDRFGRGLNEGFTETYARRINNDPQLNSIVRMEFDQKTGTYLFKSYKASTYQAERDLAAMLTARVGPAPVERAYFAGDFSALRSELDSALGPGTYYRFSTAARTGNYEYARALLRGRPNID